MYCQPAMPAARNLRVRHAHSTSDNPPCLPCTFEQCTRLFKSRSALTKHIRACHAQDGFSSQPATPEPNPSPPPLPGSSLLYCSIIGCVCSFKNRAGLTQHIRTFHRDPPPGQSDPPQLMSPLQPPSPTSAGSGHRHEDGAVSFDIPMSSPSSRFHTPSPPSSTAPHWIDNDHPFNQNSPLSDDAMDYNGDLYSDQVFGGPPSPYPSSPMNNQMDEYHQEQDQNPEHDQDDDEDWDVVDHGVSQETASEYTGVKRTYHPLINGDYLLRLS